MPDTHTRQAKRTPVTLKIKFKSQTLDQFIERYSVDVSHGGIFIRTKDPLAVGTPLRFEFQLKDATPLIRGEGTVVWTRERDPSRAGIAPGMGVRFDRLGDGSQEVLDKILAQKAAKGLQRKSPAFNEAPTRVAPSPLLAAARASDPNLGELAPQRSSFTDERTDATPLPTPMPFHSDLDDFPEEAFEEATKVASLDALVAQSALRDDDESGDLFGVGPAAAAAKQAAGTSADELAARRAQKAEDDDAADSKRKAEEKAAADSKRKAEEEAAAESKKQAAKKAKEEQAAKKAAAAGSNKKDAKKNKAAATKTTKAKSDKKDAGSAPKIDIKAPVAALDIASTSKGSSAARKKGGGGMALAAIAVLLIGGLAVGGYMLFGPGKDKAGQAASPGPTTSPPTTTTTPSPTPTVATAPAADAAVDVAPAPKAETFATIVKATPRGATVSLVDGDQSGPAPLSMTLEKGKTHTVRISYPAYLPQDVTVVEGKAKQKMVRLVRMERVVRVSTVPAGATIYVDTRIVKGVTPVDIRIIKRLATRSRVKIDIRKPGYKRARVWVDLAAARFAESGDKLLQEITSTLVELPKTVVVAPRPRVTKPKPRVTKPKPDVAKPKPDVTKPKPDVTKPGPDVTKPKPDVTKPKPTPKPEPDEPKPAWAD